MAEIGEASMAVTTAPVVIPKNPFVEMTDEGPFSDVGKGLRDGKKTEMPKYGIGDPMLVPSYGREMSGGLPESYAALMYDFVADQIKDTGGIFLDVGGGTGALAKTVEEKTGIKALSMDYSPVGMVENDNTGIVADARRIPLIDHVAGIIHIKDVIEHLDDESLATFVSEAKRVLVSGGKLVITDKDYYTGFPFFDRSDVEIKVGDKKLTKRILNSESYPKTVERLQEKYGKGKNNKSIDVSVGTPRIARSKHQIIQQMKNLGFVLDNSKRWKSKRSEPDWFRTHLPRNVMVFSLNNNQRPISEKPTRKETMVSQRFEDPRNCKSLEDLIGISVHGEVQRLRRIDWVPKKMDISRITDIIRLTQEQQMNTRPLKIADIGGLNGFLGRLILDDLDTKSSGNVEIDIIDPNKPVIDYAQRYYENKELRLKFFPEKVEKYVDQVNSADVVICSWMRPEMDLRPAIEKLKPKIIIFVKDISGDAGQPKSYIDNEKYRQSAAWLGFSGHNVDNIRDDPENADNFMDNVVLIMTGDDLLDKKVKETLSDQSSKQFGGQYPWEKELPATNKGSRIHEKDDFDKFIQTEDD